MINVTLKDGVVKEFDKPVSVLEIAESISAGFARNACAGIVDGQTQDLRFVVDKDAKVEICTFDDEEGKRAFRHTAVSYTHLKKSFLLRLWQKDLVSFWAKKLFLRQMTM